MSSPEDIQKLGKVLYEEDMQDAMLFEDSPFSLVPWDEGVQKPTYMSRAEDILRLVESIGYVSEDKNLEGNNDHYWTGHNAGYDEAHTQKRNGW